MSVPTELQTKAKEFLEKEHTKDSAYEELSMLLVMTKIEGYNSGRDSGYEEGRQAGYEAGYGNGYNEGNRDARPMAD